MWAIPAPEPAAAMHGPCPAGCQRSLLTASHRCELRSGSLYRPSFLLDSPGASSRCFSCFFMSVVSLMCAERHSHSRESGVERGCQRTPPVRGARSLPASAKCGCCSLAADSSSRGGSQGALRRQLSWWAPRLLRTASFPTGVWARVGWSRLPALDECLHPCALWTAGKAAAGLQTLSSVLFPASVILTSHCSPAGQHQLNVTRPQTQPPCSLSGLFAPPELAGRARALPGAPSAQPMGRLSSWAGCCGALTFPKCDPPAAHQELPVPLGPHCWLCRTDPCGPRLTVLCRLNDLAVMQGSVLGSSLVFEG